MTRGDEFAALEEVDVTGDACGDEVWDARCKQCGRCCFEKLEDARGRIIYLESACRYLDLHTRRCKIFERRFEINPHCVKLTAELVPQLHWLPSDCGYRPPPERFTRKTQPGRRRRGRRQGNEQ